MFVLKLSDTIAIDVKSFIIGHVLTNYYFFALYLLFESELYSTFKVIYMINIVFLLQFVDNL